jgi:hypothetical protein
MSNLKVYYGVEKMNKIKHKPAICVLFENQSAFRFDDKHTSYQERYVNRCMHLAYTRFQTAAEAAEAYKANQTFTGFSMFLDDNRFGNSLEKVLHFNSLVDDRNVGKSERDKIKMALYEKFKEIYPTYKEPIRQLKLFTN